MRSQASNHIEVVRRAGFGSVMVIDQKQRHVVPSNVDFLSMAPA
jgi:hypothetical protein